MNGSEWNNRTPKNLSLEQSIAWPPHDMAVSHTMPSAQPSSPMSQQLPKINIAQSASQSTSLANSRLPKHSITPFPLSEPFMPQHSLLTETPQPLVASQEQLNDQHMALCAMKAKALGLCEIILPDDIRKFSLQTYDKNKVAENLLNDFLKIKQKNNIFDLSDKEEVEFQNLINQQIEIAFSVIAELIAKKENNKTANFLQLENLYPPAVDSFYPSTQLTSQNQSHFNNRPMLLLETAFEPPNSNLDSDPETISKSPTLNPAKKEEI